MPHATSKLWTKAQNGSKGYFIQTPTQLRVFVPAGNSNWWESVISYYDTVSTPSGDGGTNYRGWRTDRWWLCTRSGNTFTRRVPATAPAGSYATSEFDVAVQENGSSDFVGGRVHGDHHDSGATTLSIDGGSIALNQTSEGAFTTLALTEASSLKRNVDTNTELATFTKTMTFDGPKRLYTLSGTLTWKYAGDINNCYIGMVPVNRNESPYGQITSTATQYSSGVTTNVTNTGFAETINTDNGVRITDPTSGVLVHGMAVAGWAHANRRFRVSDNAGSNKLYWKFVDGVVTVNSSINFTMEFRVRDNR
jgi:hypothetical protein